MFAIVKILCLYKIECVKAIPMSSFKHLHDTPYTKIVLTLSHREKDKFLKKNTQKIRYNVSRSETL